MVSVLNLCLPLIGQVLWILSGLSSAYPGGAPDVACESMFPTGHATSGQTAGPPFKIVLSKSAYLPGETIGVRITGLGTQFKGLYVQARGVGCHVKGDRPIGAFTAPDPSLQTRHCFGLVNSAVTHSSNIGRDQVNIYWTAPVIPPGHIIIRATIVKDKATFWTDLKSEPLIDLQSPVPPFCLNQSGSRSDDSADLTLALKGKGLSRPAERGGHNSSANGSCGADNSSSGSESSQLAQSPLKHAGMAHILITWVVLKVLDK